MKTYIGAKIIQGEPMSENKFKGIFRPNDDERKCDDPEGYHVIYPDNYHSWSPKEVFEGAYREVSTGEVIMIRELQS